jgi:hypothetical protein
VLSGIIRDAPTETWQAINMSLTKGSRGLPPGSSLAKLLAERRQVRNGSSLSTLSIDEILKWADYHYRSTGKWPNRNAGIAIDDPNETTWSGIDVALKQGRRGLPGGSSLSQLIKSERNVK